MEKILVFAHMMKTAGTALNKQLIMKYGKNMHIVPGGLKMKDDNYGTKDFEKDMEKFNYRLKMVAGHPMRPYINFGDYEKKMNWFTFFRKPKDRYVSHYFHDYKWTNHFSYNRHKNMKDSSIIEWEIIEGVSNYQTKFIAGENNYDKAVEILEGKFDWVGLTESFNLSLSSFQNYFDLDNLYYKTGVTNSNLANIEKRKKVTEKYDDFIEEQNSTDIRLYKYVKKNLWPRYKKFGSYKLPEVPKYKRVLCGNLNMLAFQLNRQLKYKTVDFNLENIKRFYNRWYRKKKQ